MNTTAVIVILLLFQSSIIIIVRSESIDLIPKLVRRPIHLDHYLCRQLHNGLGIRAIAVTNLSGHVCHTYCRVMDRIGGKVYYTENLSPNFIRCGPFQSRCVDGQCIGFNYPFAAANNNDGNNIITSPISILTTMNGEVNDNNGNNNGNNNNNNNIDNINDDNKQSMETISVMEKKKNQMKL